MAKESSFTVYSSIGLWWRQAFGPRLSGGVPESLPLSWPYFREAASLRTTKRSKKTLGLIISNLKLWLKRNAAPFLTAEVETDRISTRLGLKGRADAIFHNGDRKMIWSGNQARFRRGSLPRNSSLIRSFFPMPWRTAADGYILYSATGNERSSKMQRQAKVDSAKAATERYA